MQPIEIILATAWIAFGAYLTIYYIYTRKRKPKIKFPAPTEEQQQTVTKTEIMRLKKDNERLSTALYNKTWQTMEQDIISMAEAKIANILPEKTFDFDPDNQLIGRPIYYTGSIPVYSKRRELDKMVNQSTLAKLAPSIATKLLNWIHFGHYDTLFYYNTLFLPNGKWAITATTKPAKKTGKYMKLPAGAKTFVLESAQHSSIDQLILNKWEIAKAHAAIELAATFLGPLPIEELSKHTVKHYE